MRWVATSSRETEKGIFVREGSAMGKIVFALNTQLYFMIQAQGVLASLF